MKERGIQRSVRASRFERVPGDAPNLGRLARIPGARRPRKGLRRRRKHSEGGIKREGARNLRVLLVWSGVWALIVLGVVGAALWFWLRHARARGEAAGKLAEGAASVQTRVVSRFKSPSQDEAFDLVRRALALREPGGVGEVFRLGPAGPEAVVGFLKSLDTSGVAAADLSWLGSMDANGLLLDGVLLKGLSGSGGKDSRLAMLTPDEMGKWRIDYDAFARTVEPSWSGILEADEVEGVVRVIVGADTYFNGPFADEAQWVCYSMRTPDIEPVLFGYCRRDTAQAAAMERIIAAAETTVAAGQPPLRRATLRVVRRGGGEKRQFEITRVLAEDWVVADKAFDQGVQ